MNNTLHTWKISFGNIVDQNKKTICFLPERKNNDTAHLISAAPDLLSALEELLKREGETEFNSVGVELKTDALEKAICKAKSAIAKAKGEA